MRLKYMSVSYLFGLRGHVEFNFEENRLVSIVGANGSGKSSIMDSVWFALFGDSSPARPIDTKDFIRKGSKHGEVLLEFEDAKGGLHRVFRRLNVTKNRPSHTVLLETFRNGAWEPLSDQLSDAVCKISSLLLYGEVRDGDKDFMRGLVKQAEAAFGTAAFVSQGNIAKILSVTPSERMDLITTAYNIGDVEKLKQAAKELKKIAETDRMQFAAAADTYKLRLDSFGDRENLEKELAGAAVESDRLKKLASKEALRAKIFEQADSIRTGLNLKKTRDKELLSRLAAAQTQHFKMAAYNSLSVLKSNVSKYREQAERARASGSNLNSSLNLKKRDEQLISNAENEKRKAEAGYSKAEALASYTSVYAKISMLQRSKDENIMSARENEEKFKKASATILRKKQEVLKSQIASAFISLKKHMEEKERAGAESKNKEKEASAAFIDLLSSLASDGVIVIDDIKNNPQAIYEFAAKIQASLFSTLLKNSERERQKAHDEGGKADGFNDLLAELKKEAAEVKISPQEIEAYKNGASAMVFNSRNDEEHFFLQQKNNISIFEAQSEAAVAAAESCRKTAARAADEIFNLQAGILKGVSQEMVQNAESDRQKWFGIINAKNTELAKYRDEMARLERSIALFENTIEEWNLGRDKLINNIKTSGSQFMSDTKRFADYMNRPVDTALVKQIKAMALSVGMEASDDPGEIKGLLYSNRSAIKEDERRLAEIEKYAKNAGIELPSGNAGIEAERARAASERAMSECDNAMARAGKYTERLKQFDKCEQDYNDAKTKLDKIIPCTGYVKKLSTLTDGNNFTRYMADKAMDILLDGVNTYLTSIGENWHLSSQDGELFTIDGEGEMRPVNGMSGGEKVLVSILLLKQMSNFGCLWLDESLPMLDDERMQKMVHTLTADGGEQLIVITHDSELARMFPSIWHMEDGKLDGQAQDLFLAEEMAVPEL